ncbi:EpsG family protein [Pluralibacter gergoviae]|uniref:EpsG family protein n=1 Tax=Pluralibacter gergoviae TaxID=61647 RepID=UPI00330966A3|nr:EpsG family protein [Pluralibacter gergoviae]
MDITNRKGELAAFLLFSFFFVISFLLAAYTPVLGAYIPLIFLLSGLINRIPYRILLSLISIISFSFITGSKFYASGNIGDDFGGLYYKLFIWIWQGETIFFKDFSGGAEFFLPLYFKIIQLFFGFIKPQFLLVAVSFPILLMFYVWLELFGLKKIPTGYKGICIATSLALFAFILTGQYMRQEFGSVFLIFALSFYFEKKYYKSFAFLFLACIAHLTSIIIFPLFIILMSNWKSLKNSLVISSLLASVFFSTLIIILSNTGVLGVASYKLLFYANGDAGVNGLAFPSFAKFLLPCVFFAMFFFSSEEEHIKYKSLLVYGTFCYISLSLVPVLPNRLYNLLGAFYIGYLFFLSFYKEIRLLQLIMLLYISYRIYATIYTFDYHIMGFSGASQGLWYSYDWSGSSFLYFLN